MPKIKTRKAVAKRYVITKTKKVLKRKAGQAHFNAREDGSTKRNKRRDIALPNKKDQRSIRTFVPYSK